MRILLIIIVFSLTNLVYAGSPKTAVFAGGCFWCMQPPYDQTKGVLATRVGYTGGTTANPTYEQVSKGGTGHYEAIEITYDPDKISYSALLTIFWQNVDPYDPAGQFCDKGESYRSAVFYSHDAEKLEFDKSLKSLAPKIKLDKVATKALPLGVFYPAEDYHQSYYSKNPLRYKYYRTRCGRDSRLKEVWGAAKAG